MYLKWESECGLRVGCVLSKWKGGTIKYIALPLFFCKRLLNFILRRSFNLLSLRSLLVEEWEYWEILDEHYLGLKIKQNFTSFY